MIYVMSGGGKLTTVIAVTYPAGSVCTCGGKKAPDTSGYALFNVKAGTYTVECHTSDNSKSKSTSVTVAASDKGKAIDVTLSYELVLFYNGSYADGTGGWSGSGSGGSATGGIQNNQLYAYGYSGSNSNNRVGYFYTNNKIDLSNYNVLHFMVDKTTGNLGKTVGCRESQASTTYVASIGTDVALSTPTEYTVDIASLTGSYYIGGHAVGAGQQNYLYVSKVWLS